MPEVPSIVILKELVQQYEGEKVLAVDGNSKLAFHRGNLGKTNLRSFYCEVCLQLYD